MPITGVRGKGGSGKTTIVSYILAKYFIKLKKYTNFYLNLPNTEQIDSLKLFELEDYGEPIIVVWDEGYTEMENREAMDEANKVKSYLLFQARKNNMSIISITQLNIMDVRWRELEEDYIYCFDRPIYNRDFTPFEGDFHYAYVKGVNISYFTLDYETAKKIFPLFKTEQKIFPKGFEEMKKRVLLKDPKEKLKEIERIMKKIQKDVTKVTHDKVKLAMLNNDELDFSLEPYVYIKLKGEEEKKE